MPDTVLAAPRHPPFARLRSPRPAWGPGERVRVGEILSYLAAALPADASAGARLLALQCALRMNADMHVELPAGLLYGLRIDAEETCDELERARWLSVVNGPRTAGVSAELLDATLLAQSPARPDRRRAADWALRTAHCAPGAPPGSRRPNPDFGCQASISWRTAIRPRERGRANVTGSSATAACDGPMLSAMRTAELSENTH
nr:hypothetical protein [Streptomyces chartreusis]